MYRQQGDILLKQYKGKIPGDPSKDSLLHKGQNHHHRLSGGVYLLFDGKEGKFLDVVEDTSLTHEEHKTISIPCGKYKIEFVQEYDHWLEESRAVID